MPTDQLALFEPSAAEPSTPLAKMLHAHFLAGGSPCDAVRRLEEAELARGAKASSRGRRLSPDWAPSASEIAYAVTRGMTYACIRAEAEKFRNYWVAKAGANATKRD